MHNSNCICEDILNLKCLDKLSKNKPQTDLDNSMNYLKNTPIKSRIQNFANIFNDLILNKNLFDINIFVKILKKFIKIFFSIHYHLKFFKVFKIEVRFN